LNLLNISRRLTRRSEEGIDVETREAPQHYWAYSAAFRILDAGSLHREITETTGIEPTRCHLKGDLFLPNTASFKKHNFDLWLLDSPLSEEEDLTAHLGWLWACLSPHQKYFKDLVASGVNIDIYCGFRSDSCVGRFTIHADALHIAYTLGIPFGVSVIIA
jgi:hypothetical protein